MHREDPYEMPTKNSYQIPSYISFPLYGKPCRSTYTLRTCRFDQPHCIGRMAWAECWDTQLVELLLLLLLLLLYLDLDREYQMHKEDPYEVQANNPFPFLQSHNAFPLYGKPCHSTHTLRTCRTDPLRLHCKTAPGKWGAE